MKISTDKAKAMPMEGGHIKGVKISINGKTIEHTNSFECLKCIVTFKINMKLEENV
jgi:hypothetical protein